MTYHDMAQKFTELVVEAKIGAMAISGEIIISRLIRKDPDEYYSRPDFSVSKLEPYKIITVLAALKQNKSALLGFTSQDIKKQMLSDDLVTIKTGTSFVDSLFNPNISTKNTVEKRKKIRYNKLKKIV